MDETKHVVILSPPMTAILDVAGPLEVFSKTNEYLKDIHPLKKPAYAIHVLSSDSAAVINTSSGLPIICEGGIESISYEIDTLLIAGKGSSEKMVPQNILMWLRDQCNTIRRTGSICGGAFILAEAGILNGKRATTHWQVCEKMAKLYPEIKVEKDPIYVKDGNVYTSAGISAGMDMSLAMVEEDFGRDVAVMVARVLVLFLKRPGNQSQFSNILRYQTVDYEPVQFVQEWIADHMDKNLTVDILADKVSMSPRNFARVFLRETGLTPAKYVEIVRLETARRRLEETHLSIEEIASECGIGSGDTLRRLFLRHLKTTPGDYRRSFTSALV